MVKDHSDSERGNPLPPHGLLFPISSKGSFICTIPDRITHNTAFVTPVVEHWLKQVIIEINPDITSRLQVNYASNVYRNVLHCMSYDQVTILKALGLTKVLVWLNL